MNKIIFVPTVQHTGTWFLINFLLSHSLVDHVVELWNMKLDNGTTVVHVHIGREAGNAHQLDAKKFTDAPIIGRLVNEFLTVSPVRDPLASLVTRQTRHPELSHFHIITGFMILSRLRIRCFPVDLYGKLPFENRVEKLVELLNFIELPDEPYTKLWAAAWPIHNTAGRGKLDEAYDTGDIDKIAKALPDELSELKKMEAVIRPFLESLGYTDLLWWS